MASLNDRITAGTVDEITTPAAGQRVAVSEDGDPGDKYVDLSKFAAIAGGSGANFAAMPQVSGNPIVERGSNSDGQWVKFADGSMIMSYESSFNFPGSSGTWNYPQATTGTVVVQASARGQSGNDTYIVFRGSPGGSSVDWEAINTGAVSYQRFFLAHTRWF